MKATLHAYERSTHDLGYTWRSTMAAGTLVPFMVEVALPGDTMDINLDVDVLTHPTIGPLFGQYKVQLDVFQIPIRLYNAELHMNAVGIGMDMSNIHFPFIRVVGPPLPRESNIDTRQINPSCLLNYLGIAGIGKNSTNRTSVQRDFNAIPLLAYWDIVKNYYANKQEERGYVIHTDVQDYNPQINLVEIRSQPGTVTIPSVAGAPIEISLHPGVTVFITGLNITNSWSSADFRLVSPGITGTHRLDELFSDITVNIVAGSVTARTPIRTRTIQVTHYTYAANRSTVFNVEPTLYPYPLSNIDDMRRRILRHANPSTPFQVGLRMVSSPLTPYGFLNDNGGLTPINRWASQYAQEGLAVKTYQSDLFNNWISTEWIDGPNGVAEVTKVDTTGDSFKIDELLLNKKIYDMLNRIAISGGTYDDWLDAVYTHKRQRSAENPIYLGGLMTWLQFQEVISNSASDAEGSQPLGTLAGRGKTGTRRKGGKVIAKVDEPSYIMGIVSLTPLLDYSQGNKWDVNLKTMNDLHKPALDQIGFQELITDQMAFWSTLIPVDTGGGDPGTPQFKSAGKQPAWINYMTNVNQVKGNFADPSNQMFMVLTRRYEPETVQLQPDNLRIGDLTTYIDPAKFNYIFADTRRDAQNFWVQIGVDLIARRKMSAKIMPNL